jgi:hypothetical protein
MVACMQYTDGTTCFARAVSYECKMFMKSTTDIAEASLDTGPLANKMLPFVVRFSILKIELTAQASP